MAVTCCAVREGIEMKLSFWRRTASVSSTGVALSNVKSVQFARNSAYVTKFLPGGQFKLHCPVRVCSPKLPGLSARVDMQILGHRQFLIMIYLQRIH